MSERILDGERLLTMKEALEYLHISRTKMQEFMQSGQIQGYKLGSTWRFYLQDLRTLVNGGKMGIEVKAGTDKLEHGRE